MRQRGWRVRSAMFIDHDEQVVYQVYATQALFSTEAAALATACDHARQVSLRSGRAVYVRTAAGTIHATGWLAGDPFPVVVDPRSN